MRSGQNSLSMHHIIKIGEEGMGWSELKWYDVRLCEMKWGEKKWSEVRLYKMRWEVLWGVVM